MADKRKTKRRDKAPVDERYLDEPLLTDIPIEDEEVDNFDLDEGLAPEEIFDTEGRGLPTQYPDDSDILGAEDVGVEPRAGTVSDKFRRASQGSALEGAGKTTGYTPSEGETFTFDQTGQMVVPKGRSVENFAPGVRKYLDKLNRRGPEPKGGSPLVTPRTQPGSSARPRPIVSPKFTATETPPSSPTAEPLPGGVDSRFKSGLKPDQREAGIGQGTELDRIVNEAGPRGFDSRYREDRGPLDDLLGGPSEVPYQDELQGQAGLRTGNIGEPPTGGGGKTADPGAWWGGPMGSQYRQIPSDGNTIPQTHERATSERRTRTDVDPEFLGQYKGTLGTMRDARREGVEGIRGAIGRQFGGEDDKSAKFAAGREGALKDYLEGMDRVDRRKFIDTIAGSLGKVISGGIGLGAIPTPGVSAAGPLNVAKYYDYKPYDAAGERAAQGSRYDATMKLQKELEDAQAKGNADEIQAYKSLAEFQSKATNDEIGRLLDILSLTKQTINAGADVKVSSIFEPKLIQQFLEMDREDQKRYEQFVVDILTKSIGAQAAGRQGAAGTDRPPLVEVDQPNQRRYDEMIGLMDSVLAPIKGSNQTPEQLTGAIDAQLSGKAEKNLLTGNVPITAASVLLLKEMKEHLKSLPPGTRIADPSAYFQQWIADPKVLLRLGVASGSKTQYEGGKPVMKAPITEVPAGVQVLPQGGDKARPVPQRAAPSAPPAGGNKATLVRRNGQLVNRNTGAPVTSRQELEQIMAEDAKRGFRYPPEIVNSVK